MVRKRAAGAGSREDGGFAVTLNTFSKEIIMKNGCKTSSAAALLSAAAVACSTSAQPYEYAVFDLGHLERQFATALGLNEGGAVVGIAGMFRNNHGFVWEAPGPMEDLGTLAGDDWYSAGDAINNLGWIAGSSGESSHRELPVIWRDGEIIEL